MQPAIIFDRDNTLTVDSGYTYQISAFQWMDGAITALQRFSAAGLPLFIITNQSGIARGYFTIAEMQAFHHHLMAEAASAGIHFTDILFCPHHPDFPDPALPEGCSCRKPAPGMLLELARTHQIDLSGSVMIGDQKSDLDAGRAAGCHAYFNQDAAAGRPDIAAQADYILQQHFADRLAEDENIGV